MTLTELFALLEHPQGSVKTCIAALPDTIGDSTGDEEANELDIGKLLAVADKALTAYQHAPPKRRELLIGLAYLAIDRALWVSAKRSAARAIKNAIAKPALMPRE